MLYEEFKEQMLEKGFITEGVTGGTYFERNYLEGDCIVYEIFSISNNKDVDLCHVFDKLYFDKNTEKKLKDSKLPLVFLLMQEVPNA